MIFKQIPTTIKDMNKLGAAMNSLGALKIGTVSINDTNIQSYRNAIKGLSAEQAAFALSSKGVNEEQIREIMLTETAIGAKDAYINADIQAALAKNGLATTSTVLTTKQQEEIINSGLLTSEKMAEMASVLGLEAAEGGALVAKEALNAESVKEQLTSIGVTGSTQAQILSILGLTAAEGGAVVGTNLLTAAFQKLKKTIMSNPYLFIIGAVLAGCIGIYNAIKKHSEKAEERIKKIKEAAKEAKSEISNIKSDFENLSSSTNGIKERFATLAQGVENLGKINQSRGKLSSEDYEEFLGLSNQLAELFPQLKVGLDDNGNSILGLSGNVDTIVGSLNSLVAVQQKLANQQILEKIPAVWEGHKNDLAEYDKEFKKIQTKVLSYKKALSLVSNSQVTIEDNLVNDSLYWALNHMGILEPTNYRNKSDTKSLAYNYARPGYDMVVEWDFAVLDESQIDQLNENLESLLNEYENSMQLTQNKIEAAKAEMSNYINSWLSNEWMYLQIKNPAMKDLARDVLLNSDWIDNLPDDVKNKDWDEVSNWIQQHFLYAINNLDDEEIQTALANAVNGEFTIASLQETINELLKIDGFDSNNPLIVYLQAKLNDRNLQISNTKSKFKLNTNLSEDELNSRLDELSSEDLQIAAEQISIPDGTLLSWDELISKINEYKSAINDTSLSSFSDFFYSDDFSDTAQKLLDLAKSGEITPEVLESTEEYKTLLEKTGDTAEEAADKILNLLSDQEKLAAASKGLDSLKSAYDEFKELGFVTAATLENLPDVFKNLEVFDIFSKIAGDPTQGKEKIQQAFNDIITHYLISQDTLSGIIGASESGIQSYIANLKEIGIKNAEELVNSLRTIYKSDYDNWCDLLTKKAEAYNDFTFAVEQFLQSSGTLFKNGLPKSIEEKMQRGELEFGEALITAGNAAGANYLMGLQKKYVQSNEQVKELEEKLKVLFDPSSSSQSDDFSSSSPSTQSFDWLQTKITRTEEALDRLSQKASDTYSSWTERNNALSQSIDRTKAAIELQRQAYSAYMKEADSLGLPEHYKTLVQSGAINANDIVDSNLADQINEYQELYEKALSCSDTVSELEQSLNELTFGTRWNNIKTKLDAVVGVFDTDIELIQTKLDNLEIRGLFADSSYYSDMKDLTAKKLVTLNSEAGQLKSILGSMSKDNEGYNNLFSELMDINKEISELENNCIEFNSKIRDLDWEIFDYLEKSVSRITDETEYLTELLEKEDLFDENGSFTKYGDAALGLHSAAYEAYKIQADDYYKEILKLQKQLADGAGQDVLEHYNELADAHRDAVNAANSEKQSMLDLIEDGYNAQLDAIQELIDKKKEQLNSEKDLYDYQKSIAEKTAKVSSLEKQKLAYADDGSEEAMSRIQQLNVQLEEAKTDLAEAEYDKYLQDTEDMLDKLSEDYENWINKRLDDENALLSEIIGAVSDKGDRINGTLNEIAAKNGTFISDSIRGIFDADQPFAAVMNGVKDAVTGVGTAVAELKNAVLGISGAGNGPNAVNTSTGSAGGIQSGKNAGSMSSAPSGGNSGRQGASSGGNSWGSWFVKKNDAYSKNKLNKDSSIVDRLKFFGIDSSFASRAAYYKAMGGDGSYISSASQNVWMLNQMKSHGYKSGTFRAVSGPHWTQENGSEFILRKSDGAMLVPLGQGDMVFSNESSKRLYEFAQNPEGFMKKYNLGSPLMTAMIPYPVLDYKLPNPAKAAQKNASASVSIGDINITCNEVQNARELMEDVTDHLIRNNRFEKAMSTMINNRMTGKNPLEHLKYVKH